VKDRLKFLLAYFVFWVGFFVVGKLIFLAWYWRQAAAAGFGTTVGIVVHGLRMDAAAAAHVIAIPIVCVLLSSYVPWRWLRPVVLWWTVALLALVAGLTAGDIGLFREWGFRIDSTWLMYINRPKEMLASTASSPVVPLLTIFAALLAGGIWAFRRWVLPAADDWERGGLLVVPTSVLLAGLMVIPARGGTQLAPLTHSSVYFSTDDFANQAALNVGWNFFNSIYRKEYVRANPYVFLPDSTARSIVDSLLSGGRARPARLLRIARPNVVLIIWESFTAKLSAATGGRSGVVPAFDSLARQGVLFDDFYATGNRTDRGLPGILSGWPSVPTGSIIKEPRKLAGLPGLAESLDSAGYDTRFLYGGELEWANFRGYLLSAGFRQVSGIEVFDDTLPRTTWGFHDHVVLDRARLIADSLRRPFFLTVLTLSSHEPYDVPGPAAFPTHDDDAKFMNSHHYTDRSVGDFIAELRRSPAWDSTVVIILGDHGHIRPTLDVATERFDPTSFHIPLLWLGGALAVHDTVIHTLASQTDLARTLLDQVGLPDTAYHWGQDFLAPDYHPFAFYGYADGFGFLTPKGGVMFDNTSRRILETVGRGDSADLRRGQALEQVFADDYLRR
jgi:phosphoglycerol transferase MdoB-like AlkP superfamily enzyme